MRIVLSAALFSALASASLAQPAAPAEAEPALDEADIALVLTARADTVRFHGPPVAEITLRAEPGGQIGSRYDPGLLARLISPTVTYRDVEVTWSGGVRLTEQPENTSPAAAETPR